jgi:hypothetical protein
MSRGIKGRLLQDDGERTRLTNNDGRYRRGEIMGCYVLQMTMMMGQRLARRKVYDWGGSTIITNNEMIRRIK